MTSWNAGFRRRFSPLRLSVKLAWLSAGVTAVLIAAVLVPLSVSTRAATVRAITHELRVTQRVLLESQARELQRLESAAKLLGQNTELRAAIESDEAGAKGRRLDPRFVRTAENVLGDALRTVNKDLIVVTDDSGRVFAAAASGRTGLATGTDLRSMDALRVALDPSLPPDSGAYGVLHLDTGDFSVAAVPLVRDGRTLGAMLLGQRIDSTFVGSTRAAFDGDVVVTAGNRIISATRKDFQPNDVAALVAAASSRDSASRLSIAGDELIGAPLSLGRTQTGDEVTVWLLQPVARLTAAVTRPMVAQFLLYGLIAVALTGLGAAVVSRSVLRPLGDFIVHMRAVKPAANPARRFSGGQASPEIRELDDSFASLMQSLNESEAQLRQSQKLEAIGTLAGGVAHDFNNLLTVITGYTQLAMRGTSSTDRARADLVQVVEASDRAATLTHQLLAFSRKQVLQPAVIDLAAVVDGVAPMLRRLIGEHIKINFQHDTPLSRIVADRGQLEQVIINLVINARDAMPKGGTITIRSADVRAGNDHRVMLSVADTGVGIPPELRDRIFEPFFTTKEEGKGTGLGLSTVYGIIKQSGGTIDLDTKVGGGTTFSVYLPRAADQALAEATATKANHALPRGTETILLIEDEADVRALARRTLEDLGYTVVTPKDSDDAVRVGLSSRIDLVLADVVMPLKSGPQVVARLAESGVRPIIVYMSGYTEEGLEGHDLAAGATMLRKPFSPAELAAAIRSSLDGATVKVSE